METEIKPAAPTVVNHLPVVACVELPVRPGRFPHCWVVVTHNPDAHVGRGEYPVHEVYHAELEGLKAKYHATGGAYPATMYRALEIMLEMWKEKSR